MRLTFSQILIMLIISGISFARTGRAQEIMNQSFDIELKEVTLKEALSRIEKKADVKFAFSKESVRSNQLVNLKMSNEKLSNILDRLLKPFNLDYEVISGRIVLKKKVSLMESLKTSFTVTGTVISDTGEPIPGVNVVLQGTTNGGITGADGKYRLELPDGTGTLVFSYIGFMNVVEPVNGRNEINVNLVQDVKSLQEVVIVGYGNQDKKDVTGVVAAVDSKNFNRGAIVSPDQLITGKVAGVQIVPASGEPGVGVSIRIRGGTSINASNEPLYVIDGFPVASDGTVAGRNPLNFINPNDIATFTILKDASAAAIYGSRGANGVILITTKKGKSGAPSVTYDGFVSVGEVAKKYNVFDADQFREVIGTTATQNSHFLSSDKNVNTDWQDQIFRRAVGTSNTVTVSGGSEKMTYRASIGHQEQEGIMKTSYTKKTNFSLGMDQALLNNDLKVKVNIKGAQTEDRYQSDVLGSALSYDPTKPVYDKNSPYGGYFEWRSANGLPVTLAPNNPVAQLNLTKDIGQVLRSLGNVQLDYNIKPIPGLKANLNVGYDITRGERKTFQPSILKVSATSDTGKVQIQNPFKTSSLIEGYLNYTKDAASINSKFDITGGYSWQDFYSENSGFTATKLTTNIYGYNNPQVGKLIVTADPEPLTNRLISFFGRFNYSYKDKYLLTVNMRRDGSTRFGKSSRWGMFPSAAFAWRVVNENFMRGQHIFSDLKLRAGYGVTGNQGIGDFKYLPLYASSDSRVQYQFGNTFINTLRPSGYDSDLKWEQTSSTNIGLDFGILDGRITASVDVYNKNTSNLLFQRAVAAGANLTDQILANIGKVRNKGIEVSLNTTALSQNDLTWNLGLNMAYNKNEILALDGSDDPEFKGYQTGGISGGTGNNIQILKVGQSINTFYVYKHKTGADGKPVSDNFGNTPATDMYVDINEDGVINDQDLVAFNKPAPNILFGLSSQLTYKNFDFGFTLRGTVGNYVYNNVASNQANYKRGADPNVPSNMLTSVLKTNFYNPQYFSDFYVENASFIRMDNMTLGYNISKFSKMRVRVYGTLQNAFILTKYSGLDPETSVSGIDNNLYPRSRTFIGGLSIGF